LFASGPDKFGAPGNVVLFRTTPKRLKSAEWCKTLPSLELQAAAKGPMDGDYQVADISLADFGRKEIEIAEVSVRKVVMSLVAYQ
jgi:hypothetical protein